MNLGTATKSSSSWSAISSERRGGKLLPFLTPSGGNLVAFMVLEEEDEVGKEGRGRPMDVKDVTEERG